MNIEVAIYLLTLAICTASLLGAYLFNRWLAEVRATRDELRKVSSDISQLRASVVKVSDRLRDMTSSTSIF